MASLDDYVVITITRQTAGITAPGYGTPMILGYGATWGDRIRYYSDLPSIAGDGFAVDSPEYLAASAVLSQNPSVVQLAIGRGLNKPTLAYQVGATMSALATWSVLVDGTGVTETLCTYTDTSGTPNQGQVHQALLTAMNAVTGKNYTAAFEVMPSLTPHTFTADDTTSEFTTTGHGFQTGDGPVWTSEVGGALPTGLVASTNYWVIKIDANTYQLASSLANALAGTFITISTNGSGTLTTTPQAGALSPFLPLVVTGSAAGNWFSLTINDADLLSNKMTQSDPGVTADLNAIKAANGNFYGVFTVFNSQAIVVSTATWVEANKRIYLPSVPETLALTTVGGEGGTGDTLDALFTAGYTRTLGMYHQDPNQMAGAAWLGVMLPFDPGSATFKFKQLATVNFTNFTETQRGNLISRNGNGYENVGGLSVTFEGTAADGEFLDAIVGDDWVYSNMQAVLFNILATAPGKVEFEDSGLQLLGAGIRQILRQAQARKIYAKVPDVTLVVPLASSISSQDKGDRDATGFKWTAVRSGAIHKVNVKGNVSLS